MAQPSSAGGPELGPGDCRRVRFRRNWLHRNRRASRDGATNGIRGAARRGHPQRSGRATRRARSHPRRTGDGVDQGRRRPSACAPPARGGANVAGLVEELRELCPPVGDNTSLAIGLTALALQHAFHGQMREAIQLALEQMSLLESIGEPTSTIGAASAAAWILNEAGQSAETLRWARTSSSGQVGSRSYEIPRSGHRRSSHWRWLSGVVRWRLGHDEWREDLDGAVAIARNTDPITHPSVVSWTYLDSLPHGVLRADADVVRELERALRIAEATGENTSVGNVKYTLIRVLAEREIPAERRRGMEMLTEVRDMCLQQRYIRIHLPVVELCAACERFRVGDFDEAIPAMRQAVDE